ncbi:uncharacterized protein LOC135213077 isoform X1 [Macrobrachium nipponense]|uniref:uncharacterized protein LOC135213077 isoform X1 n=2 Tax=Macrobrachium nipponense TaxID=159736 RepID=UPI0030C7BFC1
MKKNKMGGRTAFLALFLMVSFYAVSAEPVVQSLSETQETLEDLSHPCARECRPKDTRTCHYHFKVEWYITMSKACYDCPFNLTDCARPHCVAADGVERPIVTVNRRLPGPAIHVCLGDEIIVDVENDLMSDSTSIHWHGIHQSGTQYMDGVPFVTQCPIPAGNTFRYHFLAENAGTHYWHSHSGMQRTDGMFGSLVVREPVEDDPVKDYYDIDDFSHMFILTDWMDGLGIDKFVNHHHTEHENKPYNILVNGRGKHMIHEKDGLEVYAPLQEIIVKPGYRHRLRAVSNSIQNCPIVISVDNHTLIPIASDGMPLEPFQVDSLTIYGGERWDFVVNASEEMGTYWIKFQGLLDCDERFKSAYQVAVMRYEGAIGFPDSLENVPYESTIPEGFNINKLNAAPGDGTFFTAAEMRSLDQDDSFAREPDHKFWLHYDFKNKDNYLFHNKEYYPFLSVVKQRQVYIPQINEISLRLPNVPPLSQPDDVEYSSFCNDTSKPNCKGEFCYCPHVLNVEKDSLVELILVDEGFVYWANHPFHLHGHTFKVVGMGRLGENTTLQAIKDLDEEGLLERNFDHPPTKDTVTVPDGGYTIVRFIAKNPGYWLFHCHLSFHVEVGMGLIFKVGERSMLPKVPKDFPRCGHWKPKPDPDFRKNLYTFLKDQHEGKVSVSLDLLPSGDKGAGPTYIAVPGNPNVRPFSSGQDGLMLMLSVHFFSLVMMLLLR